MAVDMDGFRKRVKNFYAKGVDQYKNAITHVKEIGLSEKREDHTRAIDDDMTR